MVEITTTSEAETEAAAMQLAAELRPGDWVRLSGELGAGKTVFARGLLRGLGVRSPVRSPTFTLMNVYEGVHPVVHADLYRLEPAQAEGLGWEDYTADHVLIVEWADRFPPNATQGREFMVELLVEGEARRIRIARPEG
jgi:tRNA threonylcarbamoyladenosine biosynthesis protein TsaE